ncbi:MAG: MarR family EPS-associated transcriptional regulator [Halothiobacillaceae bacterium]|jgi:EPS-associated MarR family transcriptional regulator|nr:MarR family EPS-associated transcriptional regulator [Halothiobacillaceae bacterium]
MPERNQPQDDDISLAILRTLERQPDISQRELATQMGVSLGKANYCLRALIEKGCVKLENFRRSNNKLAYAYILTPRGIEEKARVTRAFLRRKEAEYELIRQEIEVLRREVGLSGE